MGKLFLLFTIVPFVELYLLILIGRVFGVLPTLMLVFGTGFVGAWLARSEGTRVVRQWQSALAEGRVPDEGVLGGLLVLAGGVLLITPGVLTDMAGLLLLFPSTRVVVADIIRRRLERKMRDGSIHVVTFTHGPDGPSSSGEHPPDIIDVQGEDVPRDDDRDPVHRLT